MVAALAAAAPLNMEDMKQAADVSYGAYGHYGKYSDYGKYPSDVEGAAAKMQHGKHHSLPSQRSRVENLTWCIVNANMKRDMTVDSEKPAKEVTKPATDGSYGKYDSYGLYFVYGSYPGSVEEAAKKQQTRDIMVAEMPDDKAEVKRDMMHPSAEEMSGNSAKVNKLPDNWYGKYE